MFTLIASEPADQVGPTQASRSRPLSQGFHLASAGLTSLVALTAVGVLTGWILNKPAWKAVFPGFVSMKPNTAVALLFTSLALLVYQSQRWSSWRDPALRVLAGTSALIGGLTLLEYLAGWNLHIDQLLFVDDSVTGHPGRMVVSTAVSLIFINAALLLADSAGRFGVAQILVSGTAFLSLLSSVGYFFGVDVFEGLAHYTAMAVHTSGCLLLLCLGFFFARPTEGLMSIVSDEGHSGFVVRRLLPPIFIVPIFLAWLSWQGEVAGFYTAEFAMTFFSVSVVTALSAIIWAGGVLLQGLEERRIAADQLRQQSEERLRLAVTDAPVPMMIHDSTDHVLYLSRGWTEYLGYSMTDTPTISEWITRAQGATQVEVKAYVDKLAGIQKTTYGGESTISAKSGERRVWDFSTTPLSRVGAQDRTFLTMAVDITDRKKAEAELRSMNEDLEKRIAERTQAVTSVNDVLQRQSDQLREQAALLDLVREGIIVRDLYGTIIYWSAGATAMYGWPREKALGQVSHKLLRAVYPQPLAEIEKQVLASGFWEGEVVQFTHDGSSLSVESRWTVTKTERGKAQGFLEINRDITAKKRAAASLRDSEVRFRAVSETANEGIVSADEQGVIRYWNPGAARMFGRPDDQAIGQSLGIILAERLRAGVVSGMQAYVKTHEFPMMGNTTELVGLRADGTEFPLEVSLSSFQTSKGLFFSCILRDITDRKRVERDLQTKNEELGRSNQELEQFAYVASHDLQEPLRMVANYSKLLGTRYKDKLDADGQEFIGFAVDGALRMQALIRDLLEFARVGTRGKEFKSVSSEKIVQDAAVNLTSAIDEAKAEVKMRSLPTIVCDGSQMTQVFQNLIGNAIKFRRKDATPVVHIWGTRQDAGWLFSVKDNGIGIEPKYFERIFQMFQRLHGHGEYTGTGIGLALCKKIVERHGGRISVESTPGQSTTFSFTIPDRPETV